MCWPSSTCRHTFMCRPEAGVELTCWSEDPASPVWFPAPTGKSPRTPSVVFQTYEPKPIGDALAKVCSTIEAHPHRFAFCPSAPVRQAVLRISSWLAPSLDHHSTLRSTGEEDARCAEPTSATQTKTCTRTSRVPDSLRNFRCVDVPRRLRLRTTFGDSKGSRPSRSLRRTGLAC
jgi:hypothetical protein